MTRIITMASICVILILTFSIGQSVWQSDLTEDGTFIKLTDWQYRLGDSPLDAAGRLVWAEPDGPDAGWSPLAGTKASIDDSPHGMEWLRVRLPERQWKDPALYFLIYGNYEMYVDGKLFYRYGDIVPEGRGPYIGTPNRIVELPPDSAGKMLYIRAQATRLGPNGSKLVSDYADIVVMLGRKEFPYILLGVIYMLAGVIAWCLYSVQRKHNMMYGFGWFTFCIGLYLLCRTDFKDLYLDAPLGWSYVELASLYGGTVGFIYFTECVAGSGPLSVLRKLWQLGLSYAVGSFAASLLFGFSIAKTLAPFQYYMMAAAFVCVVVVSFQAIRKNMEARLMCIGIALLALCGVNDVLWITDIVPVPFTMLHGGLLALLFILVVLLRQVWLATVEAYAAELERKNAELSKYDKLKDHFLANTSHELRTPLNGIIGIAQALAAESAGSARKNLEVIIASGMRLNHLINDILDLNSLKNHPILLNRQLFNLKLTVDNLFILLHPLKKPGVDFVNEVPNLSILADESRIQQILNNLLGNALKFTVSGTITVTASVKDNDRLELIVSDTGTGIAADQLDLIFEEFHQAPAAQADARGRGLGLPITKRLVELHDGTIRVESQLNAGSRFICLFTAPVYAADPALQPPEAGAGALLEPVVHPEKATILVVDDEESNVQVIRQVLSRVPQWRLVVAANGEEALRLAESEYPDLILLDVMMPGMDGFEVCRLLRESPPADDLKIIFLTAKGMQEAQKGYNVGANEYLCKPIDRLELIHRINAHLQSRWFLRKERQQAFTERQLEFLRLAFEHQADSKEDLANRLFVKYETIKKDVKKINQFFGSRTYLEAAVQAKKRNMI
ncbi:response regulator [Paenibacillus athensensis]|nr:response regulator [Paenibacillus athensensis]MCD1258130.1 response regulator [Paenibacillus athensensis]